jgi:hypothetical protein
MRCKIRQKRRVADALVPGSSPWIRLHVTPIALVLSDGENQTRPGI